MHVASLWSDLHNYDEAATDTVSVAYAVYSCECGSSLPAVSVISSSLRTKCERILKTCSRTGSRSEQPQGYFSRLCDQPSARGTRLRSNILSNAGTCGPKELLHVREACGNSGCRRRFDVELSDLLLIALGASTNSGDRRYSLAFFGKCSVV